MWGSFSINAIRSDTYLSWPVSASTLNTPPFVQPRIFGASPARPDRALTRREGAPGSNPPSRAPQLLRARQRLPGPLPRAGAEQRGAKGRLPRPGLRRHLLAAAAGSGRGGARRGTAGRGLQGPRGSFGCAGTSWAGRAGGCLRHRRGSRAWALQTMQNIPGMREQTPPIALCNPVL